MGCWCRGSTSDIVNITVDDDVHSVLGDFVGCDLGDFEFFQHNVVVVGYLCWR